MSSTSLTYITADATRMAPANWLGLDFPFASLARATVVTVEEYAPPRTADNNTPPRALSSRWST